MQHVQLPVSYPALFCFPADSAGRMSEKHAGQEELKGAGSFLRFSSRRFPHCRHGGKSASYEAIQLHTYTHTYTYTLACKDIFTYAITNLFK